MAASAELHSMTECAVCCEVFTDPRGLPCLHTFCLDCLVNCGQDRRPGDSMPCPLCQKWFTIPAGGFRAMPRNFGIDKLHDVRRMLAGQAQLLPPTYDVHRVTRVMAKGRTPSGVTSLGDDVFVLGYIDTFDSVHHSVLEVYDAVTLTLRRRLTVPGLGSLMLNLAVCAAKGCLYASAFENNCIHRVELSGSDAVTEWPVADYPYGLSVNSAKNVLVLCEQDKDCTRPILREFTTRGSLVREILLQTDIRYPTSVVQLSADTFVISHAGPPLHRVCMVDAEGAVVRSFGGAKGFDLKRLNEPSSLAVDRHGNVLVVDAYNDRLMVLDPSLSSAHAMCVSVEGGLQCPASVHYDSIRDRLYVAEYSGRRVTVVDGVTDFSQPSILP